jgi:predicted lipoprotein with Yx(FWY)xxD motif
MKRQLGIVAALAAAAFTAGACGGDEKGSAGTDVARAAMETTVAETSASATPAGAGSVVKVGSSRYGRVLFDGDGRALYLFTRETTSRARCYDACAKAWPPFLTSGSPSAGRGARDSLVGTTRRRNDNRPVTYAGHPLYYYVSDRKPGQILCQDVVEFGGTWLVVDSRGRAVR